ncbi:PAS domain-containing protein [Streptomyces sp. SID4919]|uniref:PAS domain-containing protein n=1 Tax=unclassified Streptomyces TaxID=2593676 RepID=UPI0008237BBF|nr:PAS domain-containing protein [Streptomyces sp. AmelKG-E11A]MYY12582.1 PAS domain-containing protein [Streptomyces sp. SID4919]SCK19337.1 PAS domain S-box-containing protein [Streptomyces sp. AmelKG-E11A]
MSSRPSRGAARLAAILDALPDALVLVNANGTVVNANTIALEAFEAPGTALVGRGLLDLLPEFDSRLIPGSMRRPESPDPRGRTKPKRMTARRTDGGEFPVEVTSANLENGQQAYDGHGYTGDELLMLVVRDLSGTVDTEAELARSQRQTEMILRAASEGVVGTDLDGRIVLVNPAAAQILGYRANELGGKELHTLVLHSRADGEPFPYEGSPLADTLKSGRKHRVRGQVLWSKKGTQVSVDLTTAPVRDGDQLVGAVMTFTDRRPYDALIEEKDGLVRDHASALERLGAEHGAEVGRLADEHTAALDELAERHAEEIATEKDRYAALAEREKDRYEAQGARYEQLLAVLDGSLRGPLDELRHELAGLAADDAGQLWPEANQILHHLAAGYSRITTLVDNVLRYQRLDRGSESLARRPAMLDAVVAAGVEGAVELIGPGRAQFAVHAPPIEAEVDPERLATALAHLVADVAGVDSTGNAPVAANGYMDSTIVVAAAQRGEGVRIEVRGPYAGGDPVHEPIVRGIVRAHGGVLQTHEVPGMSGSAYVLEVPIGGGAGALTGARPGTDRSADADGQDAYTDGPDGYAGDQDAYPGDQDAYPDGQDAYPDGQSGYAGGPDGIDGSGTDGEGTRGGRRARRSSTDAFLEGFRPVGSTGQADFGDDGPEGGADGAAGAPTGRRRGRRADEQTADAAPEPTGPVPPARATGATAAGGGNGTGRRRGRPSPAEGAVVASGEAGPPGPAGLGQVPPGGVPVDQGAVGGGPGGRQVRPDGGQMALPAGPGAGPRNAYGQGAGAPALPSGARPVDPAGMPRGGSGQVQQDGRRARRALAPANERGAAADAGGGPRSAFALPPAEADRAVPGAAAQYAHGGQGQAGEAAAGRPGFPGGPGQSGPGGGPPGPFPRSLQGGGHEPDAPGRVGRVGPDGHGQAPRAGGFAEGGAQRPTAPHDPVADEHTPPQPHPTEQPTGRRRAMGAGAADTRTGPSTGPGGAGHGMPGAGMPDGPAMPGGPGMPGGSPGAPGTPDETEVPGGPGAPGRGGPGAAVSPQGVPPQPVPVPGVAPQGHPGQGAGANAPAHSAAPGFPNAGAPPQGVPGAGTPPDGFPAQGAPSGVPGHAPQGQFPPPPQVPPARAVPRQGQAPYPGETHPTGTDGQGIPAQAGPPQPPRPPHSPQAPQQLPQRRTGQTGQQPDGSGQEPGVPHSGPVPPARAGRPGQPGQPGPADPHGQPPHPAPPARPTTAWGGPVPGGPLPPQRMAAQDGQPQGVHPDGTPYDPDSTQGRAFSVRTLGQGVPVARPAGDAQGGSGSQGSLGGGAGGSGRRRKLGTRPDTGPEQPEATARPLPVPPQQAPGRQPAPGSSSQARLAAATAGAGRSYAIGAPDQDADEGPEPLDGPGGAVEVSDQPHPRPMDDELPPEPLDNPRRLLVWPAPDVSTQQALSDRGYRPVIVHSREEVDAQIAAFPAALFVDPLTGPITRTALQSLRTAAVAAEVPVLVTAGLGQATREAAYGADPAVLLKALAPRDSEQHPPRVLLIEEHPEIALALTSTLERRGMQVAQAANDADAVALASQMRPNLVVMDLMQVRRRRAGIVDWLRANGQLNRTPLVVYTAAVDRTELPRLAAGETVLFLAERSTSPEVQDRIVDLLARIGTN